MLLRPALLPVAGLLALAVGTSAARARDPSWVFSPEAVAKAKGIYWNWADKGVIPPVYYLAQCGDGSFQSVADSIAAQRAIAGGPLVPLSFQELLACVPKPLAYGCEGGSPTPIFKWALNKSGGGGGLTSAKNYPFQLPVPKCDYAKVKQIETHFNNYTVLDGKTDDELASWVHHNGPVITGVDALEWAYNYTAGHIIYSCHHKPVDKGVLITGYNDNHSPPYWIIKNNYGPDYGNDGYIWLRKGDAECGINRGKFLVAANPLH